MKRINRVKFWSGLAETIFATCAGAAILSESHPYWALTLLALARGSAYAKTFFEGKNMESESK